MPQLPFWPFAALPRSEAFPAPAVSTAPLLLPAVLPAVLPVVLPVSATREVEAMYSTASLARNVAPTSKVERKQALLAVSDMDSDDYSSFSTFRLAFSCTFSS